MTCDSLVKSLMQSSPRSWDWRESGPPTNRNAHSLRRPSSKRIGTTIRLIATALIGEIVLASAAMAQDAAGPAVTWPKADISADIRLRAEDDWDSTTAAGSERPVRERLRVRVRVNGTLDFGDGLKLFARARTAGGGSQQNANITFADFDGNPLDRLHIIGDRYSIGWQKKEGGIEVGRMMFPFFTPNEYFWDGDIDPLGAEANATVALGSRTKLKLVGGAFKLPVGLSRFSGALYAGQAELSAGPIIAAAGLFRFDADRNDPDRIMLLDGNGNRDYAVFALNLQYKLAVGGRPLVLGGDLYRNFQRYADSADAVIHAFDDARTGFVLSVVWGDIAKAKHVQLGYRYFRMEKLAVNASYAHDDDARFGTASQAALTDLQGSDLFANYVVTKRLAIGIRAMRTRRISNIEDDNRARLDITYSY